jgi:hypothetical protein
LFLHDIFLSVYCTFTLVMSDPDDSKGAASISMTEEQMLKILSQKYDFHLKGSDTPAVKKVMQDVKPKTVQRLFQSNPVTSTPLLPPTLPSSTIPSSTFPPFVNCPKIPSFSGEEPLPKNEISYYEWRHEVRCLLQDGSYSSQQVLQAVRNSLRGTARRLVVSMGDTISLDDVLSKFDVNFAEPARKGITMREFFNATQGPTESVTTFGCRLESILEQAFEGGHLPRSAKNELMCERLWSGLASQTLRSSTRHKVDTVPIYDHLLKEIRQVEKELKLSEATPVKTSSNVQFQTPDLQKQISDMECKFNDLFSGLQSDVNQKFNIILQQTNSPQFQNPPPQQNSSHPPSSFPPSFPPPSFPPSSSFQTPNRTTPNPRGRGNSTRGRGYNNNPKV